MTIGDLARALDLSQSSVSAALNDMPGVSEPTRARVKALADELGWRPHAGARALRTQQRRTIGLVLARDPEQLANEPFYYYVIAGIERVLQQEDYSLMLRMVGSSADDLSIYRKWHEEQVVDGIIVFDVRADDERITLLHQLAVPLVLVGESERHPGTLQLSSDTTAEARLVMEHLQGLGHRHVGHVTGPAALHHERMRSEAMRQQANLLGLHLTSVEADYTINGAHDRALDLLDGPERPTALVGSSDLTAFGIMRAAHQLGLRVPDDVAVASWDDSLPGQLLTPAMTALDRDPLRIGTGAAMMIVDRLEGREVQEHQFGPKPRLVVRGTTTSPAS
ncbi:LacI family DNA-binding transcriptional regulator [Luteococcus peritonei]